MTGGAGGDEAEARPRAGTEPEAEAQAEDEAARFMRAAISWQRSMHKDHITGRASVEQLQ